MLISIFGATGTVGSKIVTEALSRGHDVIAVSRHKPRHPQHHDRLIYAQGDASRFEDIHNLSRKADLIIAATRPGNGQENMLLESTRQLLHVAQYLDKRILFCGGAATLEVPDSGGTLVMEDPRYLSPEYRGIARACAEQYAMCQQNRQAQWTYLSPAALLFPGERTADFRRGTDMLLIDANGKSAISHEDLAAAALDEAETATHLRQRFTVAY